jgi:hypothetical protein
MVKGTHKLRAFIHGLIAEEFSGPEPSAAALDSLTAYVRALSPAACQGTAVPVTLASMLTDVDSAVSLAGRTYAAGDPATGRALLAAARATLGSIDERLEVAGLENARRQLRDADAQLFDLQQTGRIDSWSQWKRDWPRRMRALLSAEPRSLFNPAVLQRALTAP